MCLILFSYKQHPGYRLVLAANRDEFLKRPTAPLDFHFAGECILSGRDLQDGGTWLGLGAGGRLAAITNYRDPSRVRAAAPSRGEIILRYLRSGLGAAAFIEQFAAEAAGYNGFNLIVADADDLLHFSNTTGEVSNLSPGIYGLSNHLLNTPWPKVAGGRTMLQEILAGADDPDEDALFRLLADTRHPAAALLPETGVGLEWERILSSIFIHSPTYGTRSSSVITITDEGHAEFHERSFDHGDGVHETGRQSFCLP
jgi:uncharacterized protein with NRDE domain